MKTQLLSIICKRSAMFVASFLLGSIITFSAELIPLTVEYDDTSTTLPGHGKGPVYIPTVWQEGYELQFDDLNSGYTLELTDSNDNVVYSSYIPAGTTQQFLPTTLSGCYKLRLIGDTCSYIGYITL